MRDDDHGIGGRDQLVGLGFGVHRMSQGHAGGANSRDVGDDLQFVGKDYLPLVYDIQSFEHHVQMLRNVLVVLNGLKQEIDAC